MDIDRRTVVELTIAVVVIVSFTAAVYVVSGMYAAGSGTNSSVPPSLEPAGGIALVATIGLFVVLVAVAGLFVYWQDFDDE